jgi:hypothetical protein
MNWKWDFGGIPLASILVMIGLLGPSPGPALAGQQLRASGGQEKSYHASP